MKTNIKKLVELQLIKSIKTIEIKKNIPYKNLYYFIHNNIFPFTYSKYKEETQEINTEEEIKKNLIELLDNSPDFINRNKTLSSMTRNFICFCEKKKLNTENITEDYMNSMLISYIEAHL